MKATLSMICVCGHPGFADDDLSVADAARIRTWCGQHSGPGHVVTATIVADPTVTATADNVGLSLSRRLSMNAAYEAVRALLT